MHRRQLFAFALLAALTLYGGSRAAAHAWTCDDAFISFRYAENLVRGHGLVFNPGERVEGYTNPLWTVLLAAFEARGVPPLRSATGLGIVAYLALAATLLAWSWRRSRSGSLAFVPLAAALVLVLADFHIWATGGLETMLFTALVTGGVLATRGKLGSARAGGAGLVLALGMLTRPDGALFALAGVLSPWCTEEPRSRARKRWLSAAVALPVVMLNGTHLLWKLGYYGEILPTSFYAKSAADPYLSQGLLYLWLWLERNWFLMPALLAALVGAAATRKRVRPTAFADEWVLLGTAALFLGYVAYSGGDFMFARRAMPALPLLFLVLEGLVARIGVARLRFGLVSVMVTAACFPNSLYGPQQWRIQGIADEPHFYPPEQVAARKRQGAEAAAVFAGVPVRAMFEGGMCSFAYFSRLPYLVEMTGLTQMSLAKSPLAERGFIGHEKSPTDDWLDENRVHLIFSQAYPEVHPPVRGRRHDELYVGTAMRARVWLYDDAVMDPLRDRDDVSFVPIEEVIARVRPAIEAAPLAQAEAQLAALSHYYFRSGGVKARAIEAELQGVLAERRASAGAR